MILSFLITHNLKYYKCMIDDNDNFCPRSLLNSRELSRQFLSSTIVLDIKRIRKSARRKRSPIHAGFEIIGTKKIVVATPTA